MSTFDRATFDALEGAIELSLESNTRVPVAYKGSLYFLHAIEPERLHLVALDELYLPKQYGNNRFVFEPQNVVWVSASDHDIPYIVRLAQEAANQVQVTFAEVFHLPTNKMTIVTRGASLSYQATGRSFVYDDDSGIYTFA